MLRFSALALLALVSAAPAPAAFKLIVKNTGNEDLGIYFMANLDNGDLALYDGTEAFVDVVAPGASLGRYIAFNDTFTFRSGDMKWRARVSFYQHDDEDQPYKVSIHNIMTEDGAEPIELQHHDEAFIWIDPSHHMTHSAAGGNAFSLRDLKHNDRVSFDVHTLDNEEL
ncbi:hypothetical protein M885DRAFT_542083 [Pelagophyceae sp. CCMP2097]|nr:hypothetical protein M885DRAFT_542083 [Pelagophyceae sp. CCMP2097]|mmetsp:Transcript_12240/g.40813  ORF Transcript_12240/g.40813 Transcript_12240/m.40813 type:complete len:169 (+) Transcript_12240:51-557(+)